MTVPEKAAQPDNIRVGLRRVEQCRAQRGSPDPSIVDGSARQARACYTELLILPSWRRSEKVASITECRDAESGQRRSDCQAPQKVLPAD